MIKLKIFIASPIELEEERGIVSSVIEELRRVLGDTFKIELKSLRWETDIYPDIGDDAQDVINRQIGDYDVLVGMMWKRLGTPTNRAPSGTVEEFERAYNAFKKYKRPQIMFYFRITPFYTTDLDEIAQFVKVIEFRKKLEKLGVFYGEYPDTLEFERRIREHLTRQILRLSTPIEFASMRTRINAWVERLIVLRQQDEESFRQVLFYLDFQFEEEVDRTALIDGLVRDNDRQRKALLDIEAKNRVRELGEFPVQQALYALAFGLDIHKRVVISSDHELVIDFILVPPGRIFHNEKPIINYEPFYLAERPISKAVWTVLMHPEDVPFAHDLAMTDISYNDAKKFCVNATENLQKAGYPYSFLIPNKLQLEFAIYASKAQWPGRQEKPLFTQTPLPLLGLRDLRGVVSQLCTEGKQFGVVGEGFDQPDEWGSLFLLGENRSRGENGDGFRPVLKVENI